MTITLDARTESSSTAPADPYTFSHTVASGATILIVEVAWGGGANLSSVTFNGDALTSVQEKEDANSNTAILYLLAPDVGTFTVSLDFTASAGAISVSAESLFGTATDASVIDASASIAVEDTSSPVSLDLTSVAAGCWLMDVICVRGNPSTVTPGSETGRTLWSPAWDYEPGGNEISAAGTKYENASAGTYTFSYTFTGAGSMLSAVSIKPGASAGLAQSIFSKEIHSVLFGGQVVH